MKSQSTIQIENNLVETKRASDLSAASGSKKPEAKKMSQADIRARVRVNVEYGQYLSSF
jgi:hypothetical protein|tara:strand:+ start:327 stop:503 length:177 start_codon:yes stop_codon:yes gene_type:complete